MEKASALSLIDMAPIIAVCVDLSQENDELYEALRLTVRRILDTVPGGRVACINVLKESRFTIDTTLDEQGNNKHVKRLVQLKHWAEPLKLKQGAITFHVLEATSPAAALLEYANNNFVDHIVLGARTNSTMRNLLGSVSAEVASNAPCTVTVVRPSRAPASTGGGAEEIMAMAG